MFNKWNYICPNNIVSHDIKVVTFGIYVHYDNAATEALNVLILLGMQGICMETQIL